MIVSFKDKATARFFDGQDVTRFRVFAEQATRRLQILDDATTLGDLAGLQSNRLEALQGDRKGQYSIRVNRQWRICFEFLDGEARNVEIVDYH